MTEEQRKKCHAIIHSHAAAAAAGNVIPVPGSGFAVNTAAMTTMAMALSKVLGGSIDKSVARDMAITAVILQVKKNPVKTVAREISKIVPVVGTLVAPTLSIAMLEASGWFLAEELEKKIASETDNV